MNEIVVARLRGLIADLRWLITPPEGGSFYLFADLERMVRALECMVRHADTNPDMIDTTLDVIDQLLDASGILSALAEEADIDIYLFSAIVAKHKSITDTWTRTPENQAIDQMVDRLRITGIDDAAGGMEAAARQASPAMVRVTIESETPGAIDATAALADALMFAEHVDIVKFWRQRVGEDGYIKLLADPATAAIALWRAIDDKNEDLIDMLRADGVRADATYGVLLLDDYNIPHPDNDESAEAVAKQYYRSRARLQAIGMYEQWTPNPRPEGVKKPRSTRTQAL